MTNDRVLAKLTEAFGASILEHSDFRGELTVVVSNESIVAVSRFLRDDPELRYDLLSDLCGIDMYTPVARFGVIYNLFSLTSRHRLRLKTFTEEQHPRVPSVTGIWETANWHERETFDMFGIVFEGHPDLRRVYMPDDFEHFPLRKDFPLMGIPGSLPLPKK